MSILGQIIRGLDRATIPSRHWDRLERRIRDEGLDHTAARRLISAELRYQERAFGESLRVPVWARALLPEPRLASPTPYALSRAREADLEALRGLVLYLDRHRGERFSVIARKWAVGGPGEDWADEALRRLAAAGILEKRRGQGRANAPAWQFRIALPDALVLLSKAQVPTKL